jgi:hypothetical protein
LQAVKRVPDYDEVELAISRDVLGASHKPTHVGDSASESDGLGLLIDGAYLGEPRRETERKLARATREIQQPPLAGRVRAVTQVIEQRHRVRHSERFVEARGPAIQVRVELGLGVH